MPLRNVQLRMKVFLTCSLRRILKFDKKYLGSDVENKPTVKKVVIIPGGQGQSSFAHRDPILVQPRDIDKDQVLVLILALEQVLHIASLLHLLAMDIQVGGGEGYVGSHIFVEDHDAALRGSCVHLHA